MTTKSERLNWTIAIVGLIASLISIFAFLTGSSSIASHSQPAPIVVIQKEKVPVPVLVREPKVDTPGDKLVAPVKNGVNWIGGRIKKPSRQYTKQDSVDQASNP